MSSTGKRSAWWYVDEHSADYVFSAHLALHEKTLIHTRASLIDAGTRLMATSCPALSSYSAECVSWKSANLGFLELLRGTELVLIYFFGRAEIICLSIEVTLWQTYLSSRVVDVRTGYKLMGCDWGRNEGHFKYRHEGRVFVRSSVQKRSCKQ